jgi:hypothetical protein
MPRLIFGRPKTRRQWLAITSAWVIVVTVVAYTTQLTSNNASASVTPATAPSADEAAAGALALSASYPGGLPALIDLFDSGECASVESYESAPPACQSVLDQIAQMGAGQAFPDEIPDLAGPVEEIVPPEQSPDPSDQITPDSIAELQAEGAPQDLIDGLSQDPPVVPPAYVTLPDYDGGLSGPAGAEAVVPSSTSQTLPPPSSSTLPPPSSSTLPPPSTSSPPPPTSTVPPTTETLPPPTSTSTSIPITTTLTTTTAAPPPPPPPPLLVGVGDSITSGHEARPGARFWQPWRTTCDDPGTGAAAPGSSWAGVLRGLVGVPWNRYFNFAHSGSSTTAVSGAVPYTNPCGVVSQRVRSQLADARAVLTANPSRAGAANVAVADAGVNNTNWVGLATRLVARRMGGALAGAFGAAPGWAVANPGACTDYVHGNPAGNATPGAPAGAIPAAWNGAAVSGRMSAGVAAIALGLIMADPGAQVRWLLYYRWIGDPNLPPVCNPAAIRASGLMNGWIKFGIFVAKVVWTLMFGNPRRIQAVCQLLFNPGPGSIQTRLLSFGVANWAILPGYPHPNAAGRNALANCVNGTLPRAPGGGIA